MDFLSVTQEPASLCYVQAAVLVAGQIRNVADPTLNADPLFGVTGKSAQPCPGPCDATGARSVLLHLAAASNAAGVHNGRSLSTALP